MKLSRHDLSDLSGLTQLAKSTYASGEIISEEYLDWEYKQNTSGNALVFVVEDESEIVSQYVIIPKRIVFENEVVHSALSLNTITHPGYRGRGYFTQLAEMTYRECESIGIEFTLGFPNANSVKGFLSKLKFIEIGRLPLLLKVINPFSALLNFIVRGGQEQSSELELKAISENEIIRKLDTINDQEKYNSFWKKFKERNSITTDRTWEYLKWRYTDIPLRKYHLFKFEINGEIVGVAVLRLKLIMGVRCGVLIEFLSLKKDLDVQYLFKEITKTKIDLIISTVPKDSFEYIMLKNSGFIKVPEFLMFKKLHVIIRKHKKNISDSIYDLNKWFITFGDYDIF